MTDHIERNKKYREQRKLSQKAQLRRLNKALVDKQNLIDLLITRNLAWRDSQIEELKNKIHRLEDGTEVQRLRKQLAETRKLVPFWRRGRMP
jgi:hypothetical protein